LENRRRFSTAPTAIIVFKGERKKTDDAANDLRG
jgi:hypothetical protein